MTKLRAEARKAGDARLQHVLAAHPYRKFPIEEIEQAVAAIPDSDFPPDERRVLAFGTSHAFWCAPSRFRNRANVRTTLAAPDRV